VKVKVAILYSNKIKKVIKKDLLDKIVAE